MSDARDLTKFEFLPNEILIECFEYLNACHLFHSFNRLNNRLDHLIRHVRLYINLEEVKKSIFDEFCTIMSLNPEMKKQVYSLYFPADPRCFQTKIFLSIFLSEDFSNLQKYGLILSSQFPIDYFSSPTSDTVFIIQLTDKLLSRLRTILLIKPQQYDWCFIDTNSSIVNLTIDHCDSKEFYQLLKNLPALKYFHIQCTDNYYQRRCADVQLNHHLKQLIIDNFRSIFDELEFYVAHTSHLKR